MLVSKWTTSLGLLALISLGGCGSDKRADDDEGSTEADAGCNGQTCTSSFTLRIEHELDLAQGPHQLLLETPLYEINCSLDTQAEGEESCFGFRYANVAWTGTQATITLIDPFFDAVENPDATPFDSATLVVKRQSDELFTQTLTVDPGELMQPDPCGTQCWQASASAVLPTP